MRPLTVWLADDSTMFLPYQPKEIIVKCGGDQASKACAEHERNLIKR